MNKILFVRTDKIGDLVETTPALELFKRQHPQVRVSYLASAGAAAVLEHNPNVEKIFLAQDPELIEKLRRENFDASVHFFVERKSILACALAGVPRRIGPFSKMWSLLLTDRLRQNRSASLQHEAQYNADLLSELGAQGKAPSCKLYLSGEEKNSEAEGKIILHPGSQGSAATWPIEKFISLAQKLEQNHFAVTFSFGPGEEALHQKVAGKFSALKPGEKNLRQLMGWIAGASGFVANSTGPLHIAAALGVKTLSFFPTMPVQTSARRWAPYCDENLKRVLEGKSVAAIAVEEAYAALSSLLKSR